MSIPYLQGIVDEVQDLKEKMNEEIRMQGIAIQAARAEMQEEERLAIQMNMLTTEGLTKASEKLYFLQQGRYLGNKYQYENKLEDAISIIDEAARDSQMIPAAAAHLYLDHARELAEREENERY